MVYHLRANEFVKQIHFDDYPDWTKVRIKLEKLQVDPDDIERAISALSYLFVECSKAGLTQKDFDLSLIDLSLENSICELLTKVSYI